MPSALPAPYKEPWPEDRVLAHVASLSGSHFEPVAVRCFERALALKKGAA